MISEQYLLDELEAGELAVEFDDQSPQAVIEWALDRFHPNIAISTSFQADGMAILDMAWRINPAVRVFTMDTGRLPAETYDLIDKVRERYGIKVEVLMPDPAEVQQLTHHYGVNGFYKDVRVRLYCCEVRKVNPLKGLLAQLDGWITGLRRDQWASRSNIRKIEIDHDHGGIVKVNPLADWTTEEVWEYIRRHKVPYNALHDRGYPSIGCLPCTRAVEPGQDCRAGRWWWERSDHKECGLHVTGMRQNIQDIET